MNKIFIVVNKGQIFSFDRDTFIQFTKNNKTREWNFCIGELNQTKPFVSSKKLTEEEFLKVFKPEEIKELLQYKITKVGSIRLTEYPFFLPKIHIRYGKRIDWNADY